MERKDVMSKNVAIYAAQAAALEKGAAPGCKVLVVANPANTNALILKENAPSIPAENITCMTRLDHNRALGQVCAVLSGWRGHASLAQYVGTPALSLPPLTHPSHPPLAHLPARALRVCS